MAWIVDFASRMFDLYPESENPLAEPAVVLIDEIDLHLHPKWQRELARLSEQSFSEYAVYRNDAQPFDRAVGGGA